ncbi:uncharacterized protein LOC131687765 [Topomyia yanbarensis]|uniref:uncharacterized protein LOC131687765 n=1 Tax=Topomyia yanbarensis TaxID=2498891 RepID=UPI00273C1267|nr:uncharacterized protein LOC131687765 [Topomyia yanbarensis]
MDRLAKLRHRSSTGSGPLNVSSTSMGNGVGYETANDDSLTSGCSLYFSINEGNETNAAEELPLAEKTLNSKGTSDNTIDKTLENDFSVEEVSTIRKPMIAHASPATVKIASKMKVKYLGVASTPARTLKKAKEAKTPASEKVNLSGLARLEESVETKSCSMMEKMREPKVSECSTDDGDESKIALDSSAIPVPPEGNKSFGANVLANFFATLDVNKCTPLPDIKVSQPEEENRTDKTPSKGRDSNSLQSFFESLKKNPIEQEKENKPLSDKRKSVRKSLIPTKSAEERPKTRISLMSATSENRVASPISKASRKSNLVRLIPDKLKEMRKANQSDLVTFQRKPTIPPPKVAAVTKTTEPTKPLAFREDIVGDSIKVTGNRKSTLPPPKPLPGVALKRKTMVPTVAASRKSVLPAINSRRSVVPAVNSVQSKIIPLRVPAKTTITSSDTSLKTSLGKRSSTLAPIEGTEPVAKQRKSLAPVKEASPRVSPRTTAAKATSRIRPPTTTGTSVAASGFKKPETFACDKCQRSFRLKSSLDSHRKLTHQNGSSSVTSSNNNNKSNDGSASDNQCLFCSKYFANAKILSSHVIHNCLKVPLLEKRKLLAQQEDQRRAANVRSIERTNTSRTAPLRTTTRSKLVSAGSSNASNRSVDVPLSETATSSSSPDTSSASISSLTTGSKKRQPASGKPRTVGHTGITRTPKKEIKCHHCSRKFVNAVEYALHVQAHARNGLQPLNNPLDEDPKGSSDGEAIQRHEVANIVQKLATIRNRFNSK